MNTVLSETTTPYPCFHCTVNRSGCLHDMPGDWSMKFHYDWCFWVTWYAMNAFRRTDQRRFVGINQRKASISPAGIPKQLVEIMKSIDMGKKLLWGIRARLDSWYGNHKGYLYRRDFAVKHMLDNNMIVSLFNWGFLSKYSTYHIRHMQLYTLREIYVQPDPTMDATKRRPPSTWSLTNTELATF